MEEFILISGIIALVIIVIAIVSIPVMRKKQKEIKKTGKYPEGHFIGLGIAIGLPLGLPLATATDNYGLMGVGIAMGIAIGAAMEANAKKQGKIRPLTKKEKELKKKTLWMLLIMGMLGLITFAGMYFLIR